MKVYRFLFAALIASASLLVFNSNIFAQEGKPVKAAEVMPEYPGGTNALMDYVVQNVKYPMLAKKACIEGKVMVQFVVKKDGTVTDVKVLKGIGSGCDEEAVRVVKGLAKFTPGKDKGKPVDMEMVLPINFKLACKDKEK